MSAFDTNRLPQIPEAIKTIHHEATGTSFNQISGEWFAVKFPDINVALDAGQKNDLLASLSFVMERHTDETRMSLLETLKSGGSSFKTKADAYTAGFTAASTEAAGLKIENETLRRTSGTMLHSAVAAERQRWQAALASVADGNDRLSLALVLLSTSAMSPNQIAAAMAHVPDAHSPALDFARAMAHHTQGAPSAPVAAPDTNSGTPTNPTDAQREAFAAMFKGMKSPMAQGETRPSAR